MSDVRIIHPGTGGTADVPESALPHYYASGWQLAAGDEAPQPEAAPEPATRARAAAVAASPGSDDK